MNHADFTFPVIKFDDEGRNEYFRDKQERLEDIITNDLNRTLTMFKYRGLRDGLHERDIEFEYQTKGQGGLTYDGEKVRFLKGTFAPPINYLYENTGYRVVNPWCGSLDGLYKIVNLAPVDMGADQYDQGKECVIIRNDPLCFGLIPIFTKYGCFEIENNLTMLLADINLRQVIQMVAKDDNTYESALQILIDIEAGKQGVIMDEAFGEDGIKGNPLTVPANFMTQLIEYQQYIKASKYNEIGIDCNYNMKRERIGDEEVEQNADMLRPLVDVMLEERKQGYEDFKDFTGGEVNIEVEFDSIWAKYNRPYTMAVEGEDEEVLEETSAENEVEDTETVTADSEEIETEGVTEEEAVGQETEATTSADEALETVEEVIEDIAEIVEDITEETTEETEKEDEEKEEEDESDVEEEKEA